ncbi:MAG: histone deacetylase [Pirellulaceae bacterium]
MRAFYSDHISIPLPQGHRFPADKYRLLRERLARERPQLELVRSGPATLEQILRVHTIEYLQKLQQGTLTPLEQRRIGFPWSPQLIERSRCSTGGTIAAAHWAIEHRLGIHLAGGTHHAFADQGQGFCVFNDVAVAIRDLQHLGKVARAGVIDLDVHQGNGTAEIFQQDESVFTFSIHGERNFPFRKCAGDWDIGLPDGVEDATYLATLASALADSRFDWNVDVLFYLAGADPFVRDRLGRMNLSIEGLAARDCQVIEQARIRNIPLVIVMAGGYTNPPDETAAIHADTVKLALQAFTEQ